MCIQLTHACALHVYTGGTWSWARTTRSCTYTCIHVCMYTHVHPADPCMWHLELGAHHALVYDDGSSSESALLPTTPCPHPFLPSLAGTTTARARRARSPRSSRRTSPPAARASCASPPTRSKCGPTATRRRGVPEPPHTVHRCQCILCAFSALLSAPLEPLRCACAWCRRGRRASARASSAWSAGLLEPAPHACTCCVHPLACWHAHGMCMPSCVWHAHGGACPHVYGMRMACIRRSTRTSSSNMPPMHVYTCASS